MCRVFASFFPKAWILLPVYISIYMHWCFSLWANVNCYSCLGTVLALCLSISVLGIWMCFSLLWHCKIFFSDADLFNLPVRRGFLYRFNFYINSVSIIAGPHEFSKEAAPFWYFLSSNNHKREIRRLPEDTISANSRKVQHHSSSHSP